MKKKTRIEKTAVAIERNFLFYVVFLKLVLLFGNKSRREKCIRVHSLSGNNTVNHFAIKTIKILLLVEM